MNNRCGGNSICAAFSVPSIDTPHEKNITSAWAEHLDAVLPQTAVTSSICNNEVFTIEHLFSADECERLIKASEQNGYGQTNYPKTYRGNLRLISTDEGLAASLWQRIQPFVPEQVECSGCMWEASGLNECFRLSKYFPGDQFKRHVDANFERGASAQSMYTVNIYLNGDLEGGSTRFYLENEHSADFAVTPEAGRCVIFRQPPVERFLHDGEALGSGLKYLLRTDVMYQRISPVAEPVVGKFNPVYD